MWQVLSTTRSASSAVGRCGHALRAQQFGHALAVIDVHLAAEAFDLESLGSLFDPAYRRLVPSRLEAERRGDRVAGRGASSCDPAERSSGVEQVHGHGQGAAAAEDCAWHVAGAGFFATRQSSAAAAP